MWAALGLFVRFARAAAHILEWAGAARETESPALRARTASCEAAVHLWWLARFSAKLGIVFGRAPSCVELMV